MTEPKIYPLLCKKEAAKFLGVSMRSLERWIKAGRFPDPYFQVGRITRWSQDQLNGFKSKSN